MPFCVKAVLCGEAVSHAKRSAVGIHLCANICTCRLAYNCSDWWITHYVVSAQINTAMCITLYRVCHKFFAVRKS
jgi:hypothetical protein